MGLFRRRTSTRFVAPAPGSSFLVSGVTYRQDSLRRAALGPQVFRLVREPANPHDPFAVMVMSERKHHIGYVSAKMAGRYCDAVDRIEKAGSELWVQGVIVNDGGGRYAEIDCPYPEEI